MFNYRFLAVAVVGCLLTTEASARVMSIERYLGGTNTFGFYIGNDGSSHAPQRGAVSQTCSDIGGSATKPTNKTCSEKTIDGSKCYYNCYCSSSYKYNSSNCASPKVLGGGSCEGKYAACSCPSNYGFDSSNCQSPKALGGGVCGGKYLSCTCPSDYKYNSSNCASPKVLGGGSCDDMYATCACPSTYNKTCEGTPGGVGASCDGLYESCQSRGPDPEPTPSEPSSCNDYSNMTGPLFDGQANTAAILAAYGDDAKSMAPAAYIAADYYPSKVKPNDSRFGQGKWYLPAVGEALQMYSVDWNIISGHESEIAQKAHEILIKAQGADEVDFLSYEACTACENFPQFKGGSYKFWTSSELNSEKVYVGYAPGDIRVFSKKNNWPVIPVAKVTLNEGNNTHINDFVDANGNITGSSNSAIGVVYWVSPQNPLIVRIIAMVQVADSVYSDIYFPDKTPANVEAIADDPWTCSGVEMDGAGCKVDYKNFSGSLFDGQANTQKIVATLGDKAIAAKATTQFYHPMVEKDDPNFGQGKWYLPSIGEALQMQVCDWGRIGGKGMLEEIGTTIAKGEIKLPVSLAELCGPEYAGEAFARMDKMSRVIADIYQVESPVEMDLPIWTSNELDAKSAWLRAGMADLWYDKKMLTDDLFVRPVAKVSGNFQDAQIGDLVDIKGNLSDDPKVAAGIIFWVAPNGNSVRIFSPIVLGFTDYVFDADKPFYGNGHTAPWVTEPGDVSSLSNNPFICVENTNGCGEEYMYNEYNCVYPKSLAGDVCGGNYNKCVCPSNYNQYCDPYPGEGDSCDGYYTSCATCGSQYIYTRSNCSSPKVLGGDKCGDAYTTCTCPSSYNKTCSPYAGIGAACDGLYQSCETASCESGYVYDQSNCPSPYVLGGGTCGGKYKQCTTNGCAGLYDGLAYTQAAVNQIGNNALAAKAALQYYAPGVSASDAHFGQGKWYLPAIGEAMEIDGIDYSGVWQLRWKSCGRTRAGYNQFGPTFATLAAKGVADDNLGDSTRYWNSSEPSQGVAFNFWYNDGFRESYGAKANKYRVRPITKISNTMFASIGDVIYSDMTRGSASDYNGSKTAVGVVVWKSPSGNTLRVMALRDLKFSSAGTAGNFNPANPYSGSVNKIQWATSDYISTDINAIPNISELGNKSGCGMTE